MTCESAGCEKPADRENLCFTHRVKGIGLHMRGAALQGSNGWNRSKNDYMLEHFGTSDDRELGKRGIERAS